jgi:DNA mismatch endonuclease (patch repair protein)
MMKESRLERMLRNRLPNRAFKKVSPQRSRLMSAVRGIGNRTTELRLRSAMVRAGLSGWQIHPKNIYGNPDFFFPQDNLAVFVDGCFWHGCRRCGHIPNTNRSFWSAKIKRNRQRDARTRMKLEASGYLVLRFWEHELRENLDKCLTRIKKTCRTPRR